MREGHEAAILIPLAQRPTGAFRIIAHVRDWDNHMQRKIAATLAGHLGEKAPPSLLDELFQAETERDRRASQPLDRLLVQSVVEDIVFAATRWARTAGRKAPGVALLRKVVERTLSGQYWNTASYAMMGLAHHQADDWRNLLERFAAFANGARPSHPSNPSLKQECQFVANLRAGQSDIIEHHLAQADEQALAIKWDGEAEALIAEFLNLAAQVTASSSTRPHGDGFVVDRKGKHP